MSTTVPTQQTAVKILELLSHGLTSGLGAPEPGKMCVEAAVCYAMGLPHSDEPPCVAPAVRTLKIGLNDATWSSNIARAQGLKRLAIAQLGSESINQKLFAEKVTLGCIQKVVPVALRAVAKVHPVEVYKEALETVAKQCEGATTLNAAARAAANADELVDAVDAAYAAYAAAARAAVDAVDAVDAARAARAARAAVDTARAACAAAYAAARAAARAAANAAAHAAAAHAAARAANAAAAAQAAAYAAAAAQAAASDEVLTLMANNAVEALKECNSPGCAWLHLCN